MYIYPKMDIQNTMSKYFLVYATLRTKFDSSIFFLYQILKKIHPVILCARSVDRPTNAH